MVKSTTKGRPNLTRTLSPNTGKLSIDQRFLVSEVINTKGDIASSVKKVYGVNKGKLSLPKYRAEVGAQILNYPHVSIYLEKLLDDAGLSDESLAISIKQIVSAGTTEEALSKARPSDALKGIRMGFELKDRFPATKIEAKSVNIDMQLKNMSLDDLKKTLTDIQSKTQAFLKMTKAN